LPKGFVRDFPGYDDVVLVDACRGAGPPGTLLRISAAEAERGSTLSHASTHSFGVSAAIGLARALGSLPRRLVVYGIEARHSCEGEGLSPQVGRAVDELVDRLTRRSRLRGT
jgi:hydrogenase maturation protease